MQTNNLTTFLITRFGLGQNSDNFYSRELPYLEKFLIKSILKQKKYITKWIILIDINTPKYIYEKLVKLIPKDLLYIHSNDPFLTGSNMPDISVILKDLGVSNNDKVITIRIDADDIISNNYVRSVIDVINNSNIINKYELISVDAPKGVYFYPIKNKFIRVLKKGYSVQALYSIFGKNFQSVYDYSHQKLGEKILSEGGYCCEIDGKDLWIRSMRQHSVTRFGKKIGIFEGRFNLIKNIIKRLFHKFLKNNTFYKERVNVENLSSTFPVSDEAISFFENHEKKLENKKVMISPLIEEIINSKKIYSPLQIKSILLNMYKKQTSKDKRAEIKNEFYKL